MKSFFFILFLLYCFIVNSQTDIGIISGLNLSQAVYLDKADEQLVKPYRKLKPGFFAGIYVRNSINEVLSLEADLIYTQKGLKFYQPSGNLSYNTMNYIELPVIGCYNLTRQSYSDIDIFVGGYIAYWTDGKYKYTDLRTDTTNIQKVDFYNEEYSYNRVDAGVSAGIAITLERVRLFFKYTYSMAGSAELNADAITNRVFSFGINYAILDN